MNNFKNLGLWLVIIFLVIALFNLFGQPGGPGSSRELGYSDFIERVEDGQVRDVKISGERVTGHMNSSGETFYVYVPDDTDGMFEKLEASDVRITVDPQERGALASFLLSWLPFILIIAVWVFFMRQMQGGGKGAMSFGKSKAKLLTEKAGRYLALFLPSSLYCIGQIPSHFLSASFYVFVVIYYYHYYCSDIFPPFFSRRRQP